MSTKPTVFGLSGEAKSFVFGHLALFLNHIKVVFPLLLIAGLIKQAGKMAMADWVEYVMAVVTLFFYACFALAWHRSSLEGPDKAHEVNPVTLKGRDWNFIGIFMVLTGAFGLMLHGIGYVIEMVAPAYGDGVALAASVAAIFLIVAAMIVFLKLSFLFPAQSVGVRLGLNDAMRASKGTVWPLIATNFIYAILFVVTLTVYIFVAGFIISVAGAASSIGDVKAVIVGFVLSIPVIFAALLLVALSVTALSRAYQWGIQNNPL